MFKIGNREVGSHVKPLIIPEIGINTNGSVEKTVQLIHAAHSCGAEIVKFQCHIPDEEMSSEAKQIVPVNGDGKSIFDIIKSCSFSEEDERLFKDLTEELGMIFLSTPFSRAAVDRLERLGVCAYKIGSGECNNYPLVDYIAQKKKPVILSTGMNDLESIGEAVSILKFHKCPIALLHCVSMYPVPPECVNLRAMDDLWRNFPGIPVGYSDHTIDCVACINAVAREATIVEKHFVYNALDDGPDAMISMPPAGLRALLRESERVWKMLGGEKRVLAEEEKTIEFAYASVVIVKSVKKGEELTLENTWVKRPSGGIPAEEMKYVLGATALKDMDAGYRPKYDDLEGCCL